MEVDNRKRPGQIFTRGKNRDVLRFNTIFTVASATMSIMLREGGVKAANVVTPRSRDQSLHCQETHRTSQKATKKDYTPLTYSIYTTLNLGAWDFGLGVLNCRRAAKDFLSNLLLDNIGEWDRLCLWKVKKGKIDGRFAAEKSVKYKFFINNRCYKKNRFLKPRGS